MKPIFLLTIIGLLAACGAPDLEPEFTTDETAAASEIPMLTPAEFVQRFSDEEFVKQIQAAAPQQTIQVLERAPRPYTFSDIPRGFIQEEHIPALIEMTDSDEESFVPHNDPNCLAPYLTTTEGELARKLLTSYVSGLPASQSLSIAPLTKEELEAQL